ncbi:hypothetical protein [uncultured Ramlibacter sp.]|uniref:hypothetical protein n=1 Tax=uncultured Ramlibacter sp. TaxID=260755 RepID=UPI002610773F|nr:hypothetical protein [uncultured Ramlibacter sp.]
MGKSQNPDDKQTGHTGKVMNDFNKTGSKAVTQKNQGQRSPQSRSDRESQLGSSNQNQSRRGNTSR